MSDDDWVLLVLLGGCLLAFSGGSALLLTLPGGFDMASPIVSKIAQAIATAEGFHIQGSRPQRNNNPGDLTSSFGFQTSGQDGPFPVFQSVTNGWNALYMQVSDMLSGNSSYYNPGMTISQIGAAYAPNQPQWANNVASALGVTTETVLGDIQA